MKTKNVTPPVMIAGFTQALSEMSISTIARVIRVNWSTLGVSKIYFGARPYLDAMGSLEKISDNYGADSGREIVMYFLSNANTWKGDVAKAVKAELKARLSGKSAKVRRAYTIAPDGTETTIEPANGTDFTLEELRAAIGGGFVELLTARDGRRMFVDEDGRQKNLPHNQAATDLYLSDSICGTVLVCIPELVK